MKKLLLTLVALTPVLTAQTATHEPRVTRFVRIKYGAAEAIASLVDPHIPGVGVIGNNGLRAVVLRGTADEVASIEKSIQELDTPRGNAYDRDIDVIVYVIRASNKDQTAGISKEIEPVIKQLQAVFPYSGYALIDTMELRSREDASASSNGILKAGQGGYIIDYRPEVAESGSAQPVIQLHEFSFKAGDQASFHTTLDLRPNQKVVVGKTNIEGGEAGLFVVVSARVID